MAEAAWKRVLGGCLAVRTQYKRGHLTFSDDLRVVDPRQHRGTSNGIQNYPKLFSFG